MKVMPFAKATVGLVINLLLISPAQADFELGNSYYQKGNFEKAFKEFEMDAHLGDHDAQYNLGVMYYRGEYVKKDNSLAYAWITLATQEQAYKAQGLNEKIYIRMTDTEQKAAKETYKILVDKYNDQAIEKRITPNFTGKSLAVKDQRIIKSVRPKYPQALVRQGKSGFVDMTFTIDKHGATRDHVANYSQSAEFATAAIEALRGFRYEPTIVNGKPVDVNGFRLRMHFRIHGTTFNATKIATIVDEMREKAKTGGKNEKMGFAYFLETIPSFGSDYKVVDNPNEWYVNAANDGSGAASFFLGRNILYGNMCQQDTTQSMAWLLKAAKQGVVDAQYMLALESFSGAQFEKDDDKGFYWLEKAATGSNPAKIRFAWLLATYPKETFRDGLKAQTYLAGINPDYQDKQSFYQTQAAVAAENGNFKQAIKWQKKAIDDAEDLKLETKLVKQRLLQYQNNLPWREEI